MLANFVEFYLFPDHVQSYTAFLGAKYNQTIKNFTWDDGAPTTFDNFMNKKDPDQCLAIVPVHTSQLNVWTKYWQDVKCDKEKTYFICAYTNGNLQCTESVFFI